ncbi:protein rolling stone-like [Mytilus galloprovincialis]|uniref:protein rolling stone-like n=1 Tax=Mytilus galloprovincialis TaxID=29158 RepID=UPI003F7C0788
MACCDEFKTEFQFRKFGLSYDNSKKFVLSEFGPRILYPIWTTCWLMYHLGWISYDIYTKFEGDNNGDPVYFSKLTNWTFILLLLSNFIDTVTTLFAYCRTDISCDNQGETIKTPWYLQLSWLFFEMQNTAALLITILFYSLLTPNFTPLSIQYHAINSVYVILNFFVCAKPVRILHFVYPSIYGIIYSVFLVVDQLVLGNPPAYSFIDWTKPETAVVYCVVLVFVGVPIIHVTFFGLYKLRTFIKEKCEGSNRISSKQNYNISVVCT